MRQPSIARWILSSVIGFFIAGPGPSFAAQLEVTPDSSKKDGFPVKIAVEAGKRDADGKQRIVVKLDIRASYYLFANPSGNKDLTGSEVVLKISKKGKPLVAEIIYPRGEEVVDDIVGNYFVYRGKVELEFVVRRDKDDAEPINVSVFARPFDNRGCLWQPRTITQEVP